MSNSLAIAAVTRTLQRMLEKGLEEDAELDGLLVTTQPPDKARTGTTNQLDCRSENEIYVGELANWRVQKLTFRLAR